MHSASLTYATGLLRKSERSSQPGEHARGGVADDVRWPPVPRLAKLWRSGEASGAAPRGHRICAMRTNSPTAAYPF